MASVQWKVEKMFVKPIVGDQQNIVHQVHWQCVASENDVSRHTYGSVDLELSSGGFTEYGDLTEDQVIGWVKDTLGSELVARNEEQALQQLISSLNPRLVSQNLPW
jgi:hypothetical protein